MKAAFVIPCRNKVKYVARACQSVLDQTYPCEIIFSDQGSTDGSFDIIQRISQGKNVRVLQCPETNPVGMAGLNAHLHWVVKQTDADIILVCSADDWNHPQRAEKVVEIFERHNPDYVGTGVDFLTEENGELKSVGITAYQTEGFVPPKTVIDSLVGGSSSTAFKRDFYMKVGPIPGSVGADTYLPLMAAFCNGFYFLPEVLHCYFKWVDPENTGLEGVMASKTGDGRLQVEELIHYQLASGYQAVAKKAVELNLKVADEDANAVMKSLVDQCFAWLETRHKLTKWRIPPLALKA